MAQPDDSSRSSTPNSEDIDMEHDAAPQQPVNQPHSPVSPQKSLQPPPPPPPEASFGQRISSLVGGILPSSKLGQQQQQGKKRSGQGKNHSVGQGEGPESGRGGMMMDPAQGSAYDRLLDLNYPRDYGDAVLRYDMANGPSPYAPLKAETADTANA